MLLMGAARYSAWLLLMVTINLVHHNSVTECQSTSRRNQGTGVNRNLKKDKPKEMKSGIKPKIDIESETQRAIEDIQTEVTTHSVITTQTVVTAVAIDYYNQTIKAINNETEIQVDINWPSNQTSVINETDVTTPLIVSNITTNESFVTPIGETPDYMNGTESELSVNSTQLSGNDTNHSSPPTSDSAGNSTNPTQSSHSTQMPFSETPTELSEPLNDLPIISSTISSIETFTDNKIDGNANAGLPHEERCVLYGDVHCKTFQLECFGEGVVDCGQRSKRSLYNVTNVTLDQSAEPEEDRVFKAYREKQSKSESVDNSKCILTPYHHTFACHPFPLVGQCHGISVCKHLEEPRDESEGIPFWKVGLIATLTAVGAVCFVIVGIIAYVSYNKLKVRPDSSLNGSNRSQNVTRV